MLDFLRKWGPTVLGAAVPILVANIGSCASTVQSDPLLSSVVGAVVGIGLALTKSPVTKA